MIDYDHSPDGLTRNAVVTDKGGTVEALWSFDRHGGLATEVHGIADAAFGLLWDGIAASLIRGGVFGRCLVTNPTRLIDPAGHHVIAAVQVRDGWMQHRTFMVPAGEADLAFVAWLAVLTATGWPEPAEPDGAAKELTFA